MTGLQAVGVLLIVLGVVYALMYVGWLPRPRGRASATGAATGIAARTAASGQAAGRIAGPEPTTEPTSEPTSEQGSAPGLPRALTLAWAEGTYLSTTEAISRQKRVGAAGLDVRSRAAMVVDDGAVRWEREGLDEVRVAGPRLLEVSMKRRMTATLLGQAHTVLVSWRGDTGSSTGTGNNRSNSGTGQTGSRYVTGFLPRSRSDSAVLVTAVQRLMNIGASADGAPTTPNGTP